MVDFVVLGVLVTCFRHDLVTSSNILGGPVGLLPPCMVINGQSKWRRQIHMFFLFSKVLLSFGMASIHESQAFQSVSLSGNFTTDE